MRKPELLAPANDPSGIRAALAAGADAIYLGLKRFNARQKASNFSSEELAAAVRDCHRARCKVYLTFNTLLFDREWPRAADALAEAWEAGVDALIVQDAGVIARVREWLPDLPLHASTQMTVHHPSQLEPLAEAGIERVIVARELTVDECAIMADEARPLGMGIEVFVHGALCVSYSGQCLISAFLEHRSGNRGLCAQICRRPFQVCTSQREGKKRLALSLKDLTALRFIPRLVEIGIEAFKVEGRLKRPEYVAGVVEIYREALDRAAQGIELDFDALEMRLSHVFNRGFSEGGLADGFSAAQTTGSWGGPRFARVGEVAGKDDARARLFVRIENEPDPGDGVALFGEQGQSPFAAIVTKVFPGGKGGAWIGIRPLDGSMRECPERGRLFLSSKAEALRGIRERIRIFRPPLIGVSMEASGSLGEKLHVKVVAENGISYESESESALQPARRHALEESALREQLGRLGGTPYGLDNLILLGTDPVFLPVRELNRLRRDLVEGLEARRFAKRPLPSSFPKRPCPDMLSKGAASVAGETLARLTVLCSPAHAPSLAIAGVGRIYCTARSLIETEIPELGLPESGLSECWLPECGLPERDVSELELPESNLLEPEHTQPELTQPELTQPGKAGKPWIRTPAITLPSFFERLSDWLSRHHSRLGGVLAGHVGAARLAARFGLPFMADTPLNLCNRAALEAARQWGAEGAALSWELSPDRIAELDIALPFALEAVVLGRPPFMETGLKNLAAEGESAHLKDGAGRRYPLEPWSGGGGYTLKAPEYRQWARFLDGLSRRVSYLRLDVTEISEVDVCLKIVQDFLLVLNDPEMKGVAGERIDANIQAS